MIKKIPSRGGRHSAPTGPAIRVRSIDRRGFGALVAHSLPRDVPFAPRHVPSGPHRGRAVFATQAEIEEFMAHWNDSEWGEQFGHIDWDSSSLPD